MTISRREVLFLSLLGLLAGASYFVTSHLVRGPELLVMPGWVPFLPVLTVPYLLQVVVSYVLAMYIADRARRHALFKAYFLSLAIVFAMWTVHPTEMLRPDAPPGWWNWPYAVMARTDLPLHIWPAGHILMPVLLIWACWYERRDWLWWLVPAQIVGAVGIATTWQHRPVDILLGACIAFACGLVFRVQAPGAARAPSRASE
ncbi:MAG: hypothetical protein H3C62_12290 [Gemmatimonadaceae bacterium]|nr:hypothetical protein [Gemmatimonadaceae bacterium]